MFGLFPRETGLLMAGDRALMERMRGVSLRGAHVYGQVSRKVQHKHVLVRNN